MNTTRIDIINIGLMLISTIVASLVPFELFLFSYAVLGPLHYLTEIGWLHKRNYFTKSKMDYLFFIPVAIILTFVVLFKIDTTGEWANALVFVSFAAALAMLLFENVLYKFAFISIAFIIGLALSKIDVFIILFGVFLPTIIHVFLFTGLFVLTGALKNKSWTGILSVIVFAACTASFFIFQNDVVSYSATEYARKSYFETKMVGLNFNLMKFFGEVPTSLTTIYDSNFGKAMMRFIAFAYTYHYLNWFSKTSVIKWHDVPKNWLITIAVVWVISVSLYAYDYATGLAWLYLLSMLHVFLEFPLNFQSFKIIGQETMGLFKVQKV